MFGWGTGHWGNPVLFVVSLGQHHRHQQSQVFRLAIARYWFDDGGTAGFAHAEAYFGCVHILQNHFEVLGVKSDTDFIPLASAKYGFLGRSGIVKVMPREEQGHARKRQYKLAARPFREYAHTTDGR